MAIYIEDFKNYNQVFGKGLSRSRVFVNGAQVWGGDGWDIDYAGHANESDTLAYIDTAAIGGNPGGISISPDGTMFFILVNDLFKLRKYTLTTPYDLSTAVHHSDYTFSLDHTEQPSEVYMKADGTGFYVSSSYSSINSDNAIYQFAMSTPWDMTTVTSVGTRVWTSSYPFSDQGVHLSDDGSKAICMDFSGNLTRYILSTPWDITTMADSPDQTKSIDVPAYNHRGFTFDPTGHILLVSNSGEDDIYEWWCSTAWDITTATKTSKVCPVYPPVDSGVGGVLFSRNGLNLYFIDYVADRVYQLPIIGPALNPIELPYSSTPTVWNVPAGVTHIRAHFIGGGAGGGGGPDTVWNYSGKSGEIKTLEMDVTPGQQITYQCGEGGGAWYVDSAGPLRDPQPGTATIFNGVSAAGGSGNSGISFSRTTTRLGRFSRGATATIVTGIRYGWGGGAGLANGGNYGYVADQAVNYGGDGSKGSGGGGASYDTGLDGIAYTGYGGDGTIFLETW